MSSPVKMTISLISSPLSSDISWPAWFWTLGKCRTTLQCHVGPPGDVRQEIRAVAPSHSERTYVRDSAKRQRHKGDKICTHFTRGGTWRRSGSRHCAACRKVAGSVVSLELFIDIILPASKRHEWQEYFVRGGKGGRCVGLIVWDPQPPWSLCVWTDHYRDVFTFVYRLRMWYNLRC